MQSLVDDDNAALKFTKLGAGMAVADLLLCVIVDAGIARCMHASDDFGCYFFGFFVFTPQSLQSHWSDRSSVPEHCDPPCRRGHHR